MKYICMKIPVDFRKSISVLSDAEVGRLFSALLSYMETGEEPRLKGNERFLWGIALHEIKLYKNFDRNAPKGEKHWNWKGGVTPQNQIGRSSKEYTRWRKAVFERDGFKCQCCGQVGGTLNAHHIVHWAKCEELRYEINNGITLCKRCHKKIHGR